MVKEDIYKLDRILDRDIERRIIEIFPDNQEDNRAIQLHGSVRDAV
ncbi:hypothetical protein ANME2D_01407 [Candidatus Methanoperedens nitroreducens]|uniref:Uncharacterized protein n=1 Tax=Candidatus Methanoperedens nitratireducens TaxID=1392998 RepID=A0A062V616_9EURY|nr:hypothetical protein [Candidatus Methanoperedens nitroreducens]KCZ72008.1 hypothetical protein ANME2D_01407 [Candidatus Methanoperedens nitroreducens]MDJ1422016.1 hypothetical protein [Candidatus Methanoperedens sp.]